MAVEQNLLEILEQRIQHTIRNSTKTIRHERTCPRSNSAITQPVDQISIAVVYSVAPNMSSGAR